MGYTKDEYKTKAISRGIALARSRDAKIKALEKKLFSITKEHKNIFTDDQAPIFADHERQILSIKTELDELYQYRTSGAMLRAKANWVDCGDKLTKYFLSLEKRNYNRKTINKIIDPATGLIVSSQQEVMNVLNTFFSQLYKEKEVVLDPDYLALLDLPQISDKDNFMLDAPIQLEEIHIAVKQLKLAKCPGPDGFTAEFYVKFWNALGKALHTLFLKKC